MTRAKLFSWKRAGELMNLEGIRDDEMEQKIEFWGAMYQNRAPWISEQVKSLNLPATIASELARLTTIEMRSEITGSRRADLMNAAYQQVVRRLRDLVESGCAKGGFLIKPYVRDGRLEFDYVQADRFCPIESDDRQRVDGYIVFESVQKSENCFYTRLEMQRMTDGGCEFVNRAFVGRRRGELGREVALSSVDAWAGLEPYAVVRNVKKPFFAYFKTPFANTVDMQSPLGVSAYARAAELIEQADRQYSRLLWEFESGERALYVDADAFYRDPVSGRAQLPDRKLYRTLDLETGGDGLFSEWTPQLREQNIISGLNTILMKIEDSCGLARGTISETQDYSKTATELKIMRQRSYATVTDMQKMLRGTLEDLTEAMNGLCSLYGLAPEGKYTVSFDFDDSVVSDRSEEFAEKQTLVADGIMRPWEFRMWYFGESEEAAKKALETEKDRVADESGSWEEDARHMERTGVAGVDMGQGRTKAAFGEAANEQDTAM